ncbi:MAG: FecR domain-containing protein, partial [Angelakisella sp.]
MKKMLVLFLAVLLVLTPVLPNAVQIAAAKETAVATTLRLKSIEGEVTLCNENGRTLTIRDNMKLYSGYTITTGTSSYAYVGLDDTKAIKLDASTSVEVRKRNKSLEVLVSSGAIFFNVTEPLKEDETMEIRTSTMITGIRGTAGMQSVSELYLLDGQVQALEFDRSTGQTHNFTVHAGERTGMPSATSAAPVSSFTAQEVPG